MTIMEKDNVKLTKQQIHSNYRKDSRSLIILKSYLSSSVSICSNPTIVNPG